MKGWGWMVANKRLQQTDSDWSVAKENLGLKAWDWGITFEGFQLNACDWQDRLVAIEVLQLKGVETEGYDLMVATEGLHK